MGYLEALYSRRTRDAAEQQETSINKRVERECRHSKRCKPWGVGEVDMTELDAEEQDEEPGTRACERSRVRGAVSSGSEGGESSGQEEVDSSEEEEQDERARKADARMHARAQNKIYVQSEAEDGSDEEAFDAMVDSACEKHRKPRKRRKLAVESDDEGMQVGIGASQREQKHRTETPNTIQQKDVSVARWSDVMEAGSTQACCPESKAASRKKSAAATQDGSKGKQSSLLAFFQAKPLQQEAE